MLAVERPTLKFAACIVQPVSSRQLSRSATLTVLAVLVSVAVAERRPALCAAVAVAANRCPSSMKHWASLKRLAQ